MNHTQYTGTSSARRYLTYNDACFRGYQDQRSGEWTEDYETANEHWQRRYEAGRHLAAAYENWCRNDKFRTKHWVEFQRIPKRLTKLIYNFAREGYFG